MKPLYHCLLCGRISTKANSYKILPGGLVCSTDCTSNERNTGE